MSENSKLRLDAFQFAVFMIINYFHSFRVVFKSSEDPDYPASQLNEVSPTTKGWMSVRFCSYPQELGFQLTSGESKITQIQFLSHQSKISSKVEIFIGSGNSYETAQFKRLGYMSLNNNERSSYQARELKTVHIDHVGSFLRLVVYENHKSKQNAFNQVGIVALSLLGTPLNEAATALISSQRGVSSCRPAMKNSYNDLTVDINLDPQTANKLRQLAEAKSRAIKNEDYHTAKQIKTVEQELKTLGSRLAQLDMAKVEAVNAEDYDLASDIKEECDGLRFEIEEKVGCFKRMFLTLIDSSCCRFEPFMYLVRKMLRQFFTKFQNLPRVKTRTLTMIIFLSVEESSEVITRVAARRLSK
jgi:centrosomal protein CEP104